MQESPGDPRTTITIDRPTSLWAEGLPLGNGRLGVMLYGGPEQVSMSFGRSDFWDDRVGPGQGLPEDKTTFDEMVALAAAEDWEAYNRIFADWLARENCSQPSLQTCGQLELMLQPGERAVDFRQSLDLQAATARIESTTTEYREGRQTACIEAFVPIESDVMVARLTLSEGERELFGRLRLWRHISPDGGAVDAWAEGDVAGIDVTLPDGSAAALAVRVVGASGRWQGAGTEAVYIIERASGPVLLLATVTESRTEASARLAALTPDSADDLGARHRSWWEAFWSHSDVTLPDERFERFWRLGLYVLASSSQPGCKAPGLQGPWNRYNRPTWHTDYHTDMNIQMIYWPAYATNHLELCEPYYRLFSQEMADEARRAAKVFFRRRGMYFPIAPGPRGHELAAPWMWPGAGAWVVQHFVWHWQFSRDETFLAETYPFLKELSEFYEDFLKKNDRGRYDYGPSYAPEMPDRRGYLAMAWGMNPTGDLSFIGVLFSHLADAAEVLGVDGDHRDRWRDIAGNLADYPTGPDRLENLEGEQWAGRHPMPVTASPLWPAGDVTLDSDPDLLAKARGTYELVRDGFRSNGHNTVWAAAVGAHLGLGDEVADSLNHYLDTAILPSGLHVLIRQTDQAWSGLMQIEATTAFSSAIAEMLLQSLDGVIRIFPAVPAGWTASFKTLRAAGAFLVSAAIEDGRVLSVRIDSEKGRPCVVADPFGSGRATLDGAIVVADGQGRLAFETSPGQTYELTPEDA